MCHAVSVPKHFVASYSLSCPRAFLFTSDKVWWIKWINQMKIYFSGTCFIHSKDNLWKWITWLHFKNRSLFFFLCSRVHHEGIFVRQSRLRVRSRGCEALVGFLSRPSTQSFSHLFSRCFFSILVCEAFSNCHLFFLCLFGFHFMTSVWLYTFWMMLTAT